MKIISNKIYWLLFLAIILIQCTSDKDQPCKKKGSSIIIDEVDTAFIKNADFIVIENANTALVNNSRYTTVAKSDCLQVIATYNIIIDEVDTALVEMQYNASFNPDTIVQQLKNELEE